MFKLTSYTDLPSYGDQSASSLDCVKAPLRIPTLATPWVAIVPRLCAQGGLPRKESGSADENRSIAELRSALSRLYFAIISILKLIICAIIYPSLGQCLDANTCFRLSSWPDLIHGCPVEKS